MRPEPVAGPPKPAADDLVVDLTTYETKPADGVAAAAVAGPLVDLPVADTADDADAPRRDGPGCGSAWDPSPRSPW